MKYTRNFLVAPFKEVQQSNVSATVEWTPAADLGLMFRMESLVILPDFQGHPTESVLRAAVSFLEIRKNRVG